MQGSNYAALDELVSPYGVVYAVRGGSDWRDPLPFEIYAASVGSGKPGIGGNGKGHTVCCGRSDVGSAELARLIAIAEGAERYVISDHPIGETIWATAEELEGRCVEPWRIPKCSATELAAADSRATNFDPSASIRWSLGKDLINGEPVWVPAAMVCLGLLDRTPGERFTSPISTGYAVHTSFEEAVVGGIREVVERDIISLLWLQTLTLPRVRTADYNDMTARIVEWGRRHFLDIQVFDATSDLRIPTAYCLVRAPYDTQVATTVGAGTGWNMQGAVAKAVCEAVGIRALIQAAEGDPRKPYSAYREIEDGAVFMALAENSHAFDFLTRSDSYSDSSAELPQDPHEALNVMMNTFAAKEMRPIVVERTTKELAAVGLTAVCVVIPDLQPMSVDPLVQFKGHARLYEAPRLMGYTSTPEEGLNSWPQPFA
ncbi:YcaO-like family protein [Streptomyces sp. NPDC001537]